MIKNKLKEIRLREFMITQGEFAKLLEIDYRQYNRYENGTIPNLETVLHIAKKLNRNVESIFYLDDLI